MKVCAPNPNSGGEYSLCGDAFDAPDTEDDVEEFRIGESGDLVTCPKCREAILEIKAIKRWRIP